MLSPDRISSPTAGAPLQDYDTVRQALRFITEQWRDQPEIEAIAHACGVTPDELHHLFRRWASLTPKAFLQAITIDHARALLRDSASVLDAAYEVGLSGPGRLHDLFVTHEAMSPGEWKSGGEGLTMHYGFHSSPFGKAIVVVTDRGLAGLGFADPGEERAAIDDMQRRWPRARLEENAESTAPIARRIFELFVLAERSAVARGDDRHGFRSPRVGDAARHSDGPRLNLFRHREEARQAERGTRSRRCGRQKPDLFRGAVSPRARQERRHHGLSLGPDAQARHAWLGSGPDGGGVIYAASSSIFATVESALRR